MRSFDGAQINLEFSGIPDGVEVTIDAWAATAEDLDGTLRILWWIKPLRMLTTPSRPQRQLLRPPRGKDIDRPIR